jgi:hypothetical protein
MAWKENLSFTHVIVGFVQLEVYLPNGKNGHNFWQIVSHTNRTLGLLMLNYNYEYMYLIIV